MHRYQFLLLLFVATPIHAGPLQDLEPVRWISPLPTGSDLNRIVFVDEKNGWIVGDYGTILYSSNGGAHWTKVHSGTITNLRGISFVSKDSGWIVGDGGFLLVTANGGKAWEEVRSPVRTTLNDIEFLNQNVGIAIGDFGVILRTTDGGTTWNFFRSGDPRDYTRIALNLHGDGIITASDGTLYRVERFGPLIPIRERSEKPLIDAAVSRSGNLFVALNSEGGIVTSGNRLDWSTTDGPESQLDPGTKFSSLGVLGHNTFLLGSTSGNVWVFFDRRRGWQRLTSSQSRSSLNAFTTRDDSTVFAVGKGGEILQINVIRGIVSAITKRKLPSVRKAAFLDEDNALVLTRDQSLMLSTDGGNTWRREGDAFVLLKSFVKSLRFVTPLVGFALTTGGILQTTDGGESWRAIPFTQDFLPMALDRFGDKEVWFSGDGYLAITKGGGASLMVLLDVRLSGKTRVNTLLPSTILHALPFSDYVWSLGLVSTLEWIAVTSNQSLFRTVDGGATWKTLGRSSIEPVVALTTRRMPLLLLDKNAHGQAPVGGPSLVGFVLPEDSTFRITDLIRGRRSSIDSLPGGHAPIGRGWLVSLTMAWISSLKGSALKSVDGGDMWARVKTPTTSELTSISFLGDQDGWLTTKEGSLFLTSDGGATWELVSTRTPGIVTSLEMVSAGQGWAITEDGELFSTSDAGVSWRYRPLSTGQAVASLAWDPSGAVWIARGRDIYEVRSITHHRVNRYELPIKSKIKLLGIAADSSVFFLSDDGEVGSIKGDRSHPSVLADRIPDRNAFAISGPAGLDPIVLTTGKNHYRWNQSEGWRVFYFPSENIAESISFVDSRRGVVVGGNGMMFMTYDGGRAWFESPRSTFSRLLGVIPSSTLDLVWASGHRGTVLVSQKKSYDWKRLFVPINEDIVDIQFLPPDLLFLYSQDGSILRINALEIASEE